MSGDGTSGLMSAARLARAAGGTRVTVALGSNLGNRLENLQGGLDALFDAPGLDLVAVSPVYQTAPVGGPRQPDYLNAVLTGLKSNARAGGKAEKYSSVIYIFKNAIE